MIQLHYVVNMYETTKRDLQTQLTYYNISYLHYVPRTLTSHLHVE